MRAVWSVTIVALLGVSPATASPAPGEVNQVLRKYNAWVHDFNCFTGGGKVWVGASGRKDRAFRFSLAVQNPGRFRLQGRFGAAAQVFDLSHAGDRWILYLPQARQVVRGDCSDSTSDLMNPRDYLQALMPVAIDPETVARIGAASFENRVLRVSVPADTPFQEFHRVLDIERTTGNLIRQEIRRTSRLEKPLAVVTYSHYQGKPNFPLSIEVKSEEAWARMEFRSVRACESLDGRRFKVRIPLGTQELPVDSLDYTFLPVVEDAP